MTDDDQELARGYLAGDLTEEERVMIEQRIVTDPAFLEEVRLTEAMRDGLRHLSSHGQLAPLLAPSPNSWGRPAVALAASIAALAFAATSVLIYQRMDHADHQLNSALIVVPTTAQETLLFERTRSNAAADVIWRRRSTPTLLNLLIDVGLEPALSYTVTIERLLSGSDTTLLSVRHVGIDEDGFAAISINSELLDTGVYQVSLTPHLAANLEQTTYTYMLEVIN